MPFIFTKKQQQPQIKKAIIPATPKKALDYNSILCYLLALWRKACFKFYRKTRCAEGVRQGEKKEKSILAEVHGGNADANTRFIYFLKSFDAKEFFTNMLYGSITVLILEYLGSVLFHK